MFTRYFLINIFLFSTPIFGVDLQYDDSKKDDPYDFVKFNTYHHFSRRIEAANTNTEREKIYAAGIADIEEAFAIIEDLYKVCNPKLKDELKNVLTEQLIRYNTYPGWLLSVGKLVGYVPWYIYK